MYVEYRDFSIGFGLFAGDTGHVVKGLCASMQSGILCVLDLVENRFASFGVLDWCFVACSGFSLCVVEFENVHE